MKIWRNQVYNTSEKVTTKAYPSKKSFSMLGNGAKSNFL